MKTVATKHAQVWLSEDTEGLGWYRGPVLLTALGTSFDTWADMTHTLPAERAHRNAASEYDRARSVAYFCAALPDALIARLGRTEGDLWEEGLDGTVGFNPDTLLHAALERADGSLREALGRTVEMDLDALLDGEMRHAWPHAFGRRNTDPRSRSADTCRRTSKAPTATPCRCPARSPAASRRSTVRSRT